MPALTSAERDQWSQARQALEANGNQEALHRVDSAIFALVLDRNKFEGSPREKMAHHFLHGPVENRLVVIGGEVSSS